MRYNLPKFLKLSEMAQIDAGRLTEQEALGILEGIRWSDGIKCPHCGSSNVVKIQGKANSVRIPAESSTHSGV